MEGSVIPPESGGRAGSAFAAGLEAIPRRFAVGIGTEATRGRWCGGCDSRKPKFGHALVGAEAPCIGNAVKTSTSPRGNASVFIIFDFSASRWQEQGNWMPVAACGFMTHKGRLP